MIQISDFIFDDSKLLETSRIAINSVDSNKINYHDLHLLVNNFANDLKIAGVTQGDAVALIMHQSGEAYIAMLAIMKIAACAPLNYEYQQIEFENSLNRINPKVVITSECENESLTIVCKKLKIPILSYNQITNKLQKKWSPQIEVNFEKKESKFHDVALLLFTSATTGKPKIVPLSHQKIIDMVAVMRNSFPIADTGNTLIITPHYHLHSILSVFTQFFSGGQIIATHGFNINEFKNWLQTYRPTQFTANPTIFKAILSFIETDTEVQTLLNSLRFVTCAGAFLSDTLKDEIEKKFGVPMVEGYGMTESGRITITPIEKEKRKPNSVGKIVGVDVAIMDENDNVLPNGKVGEIAIKGSTVIDGYFDDAEANENMFRQGWFYTGDLGWVDNDGFLFLTGRKKEMINKGSEKILPQEIEDVVITHPEVIEVAVFAYPHSRLGEDIAAAIVSKNNLTHDEIKLFVAKHLAPYKIPRLILFVDEIPKSSTGKIQRNQLYKHFFDTGFITTEIINESDLNPLELQIADVWKELLKIENIKRTDDFFLLGGDSLMAQQMHVRIEERFSINIPVELVLKSASLEGFTNEISEILRLNSESENIVQNFYNNKVTTSVVFLFHLIDGNLFTYKKLIHELRQLSIPVSGIKLIKENQKRVNRMKIAEVCKIYANEIIEHTSNDEIYLAGHSAGGIFALETARYLKEMGYKKVNLILIDTYPDKQFNLIYYLYVRTKKHLLTVSSMSINESFNYLGSKFMKLNNYMLKSLKYRFLKEKNSNARFFQIFDESKSINIQLAEENLKIQPFDCNTLLFWCKNDNQRVWRKKMLRTWKKLNKGKMQVVEMGGNHHNIISEDNLVRGVASEIKLFIESNNKL